MQAIERKFSSKRTKCPSCGSSDGFARVLGKPNEGYCHACIRYVGQSKRNNVSLSSNEPKARSVEPVPEYVLKSTQGDTSNLHHYLVELAGQPMRDHLKTWKVGTDSEGRTIWNYFNVRGEHVTSKGMVYLSNGKRHKGDNAPAPRFGLRLANGEYLSLAGREIPLYGSQFLAFGSSLRDYRTNRTHTYTITTCVFLTESEKSAMLASFWFPEYVWLGTGGVSGMTEVKATALKSRHVIVLYDSDSAGEEASRKTADKLKGIAASVRIGSPQMLFGTEIANGFDIGDYVIENLQTLPEYTDEYERDCIQWADGLEVAS